MVPLKIYDVAVQYPMGINLWCRLFLYLFYSFTGHDNPRYLVYYSNVMSLCLFSMQVMVRVGEKGKDSEPESRFISLNPYYHDMCISHPIQSELLAPLLGL